MTIDGIDISTFGLQLSRPDGHLDQPARKAILAEPGFEVKDIVFDSKEPSISLIGIYDSKADLLAGIQGLNDLIRSALVHDFVISSHNLTFSGVVTDGIKTEVTNILAKTTFKIKITE